MELRSARVDLYSCYDPTVQKEAVSLWRDLLASAMLKNESYSEEKQ